MPKNSQPPLDYTIPPTAAYYDVGTDEMRNLFTNEPAPATADRVIFEEWFDQKAEDIRARMQQQGYPRTSQATAMLARVLIRQVIEGGRHGGAANSANPDGGTRDAGPAGGAPRQAGT